MVEELDLADDVSTIAEMIDAEIRSCIPDSAPQDYFDDQEENEAPNSVDSTSDLQNEYPPPVTVISCASPGLLALERLPSGRKYWSDSPKGSFSPLRPPPSNVLEGNTQSGPACSDDHHSNNDECIDKADDDDNTKENEDADENEYEDEDEGKTEDGDGNKNENEDQDGDKIENEDQDGDKIDNEDQDGDKIDNEDLDGHKIEDEIENEDEDKVEDEYEDTIENDDDDENDKVESIVEKLETLLLEQQTEMDELKKKHGLVVSDNLKKLRPETCQEVANICKVNLSEESSET